MRCLIVDTDPEPFGSLMDVARSAGHDVMACVPTALPTDELDAAQVLVVRWRGPSPSLPTDDLHRLVNRTDPLPPLHVAAVEAGDDEAVNAAMEHHATIILTPYDLTDPWTLTLRCRQLYAAIQANQRAGEVRVDRLAEHLPGVVFRFVMGADGGLGFEYISDSVEKIMGVGAAELVAGGEATLNYLHPDDLDGFRRTLTESARTMHSWQWEGRVHNAAGDTRWFSGVSRPERRADGALAWEGMLFDVTDRHESELESGRANARFEAIIEAIPDAVLYKDLLRREVVVNRAFTSLFRYAASELAQAGDDIFFTNGNGSDPGAKSTTPVDLRSAHDHDGPVDIVCRRADGKTFPGELHAAPVRDKHGEALGYVTIIRDTTERKDIERRLADVSNYEQRRIGQELHDGIGQQLSGLAFLAKSLQGEAAGASPSAAETAGRIKDIANESIDQLRNYSAMLAPLLEVQDSLVDGLCHMAEHISELFAVDCRVEGGADSVNLDSTVATHLYRIVQEAINNALRHGEARAVVVALTCDTQALHLTVNDNGTGMTSDIRRARKKGMGMRIMASRASAIGATFDVESTPGAGVTVKVTCPLWRYRAATPLAGG